MKIISLFFRQSLKIVLIIIFLCTPHFAKDPALSHEHAAPIIPQRKRDLISMDYDDKPIIDIINFIAEKLNYNVLLPTGKDALTAKVTLHIKKPMTAQEAWKMLYTLLDIDGYTIVPKGSMYVIVKSKGPDGKDINMQQDTIPLYIGDPDAIPDTNQRIRFLYYLANIKVSSDPSGSIESAILKEVLSPSAKYQIDTKTNSIIISDKANNIKSAMTILTALDKPTFREKLEILSLHHTDASTIADFINTQIITPITNDIRQYQMRFKKPTEASLFQAVRVVPDPRTNALILLGRDQAVAYLKTLIQKTLDVEPETGQSVLHVYSLKYLNASTFAPILQAIVDNAKSGGTAQSSSGAQLVTGAERQFEGVKVTSDAPDSSSATKDAITYFGGNKVIVAAKNDDWMIIKELIEELDQPQRQVIIEVLIADLTMDETRALGNLIRNPASLPMPGTVTAQAANLGGIVLDATGDAITPATNLASDLLQSNQAGFLEDITVVPNGSSILSISDPITGRTWNVTQLLSVFASAKVLGHPHVVTVNNKKATITVGQTRLIPDDSKPSSAAQTITYINKEAATEVNITPRISSANTVTLMVSVISNSFVSASTDNNTIANREVTTTANVRNSEILVLGGLSSIDDDTTLNDTPLLGKIPLFGWIFKNRNTNISKKNLTIFISPTIIEPRQRDGGDVYTRDYLVITKDIHKEAQLFEDMRDPVTRLFFGGYDASDEIVDSYVNRTDITGATKTKKDMRKQIIPNPNDQNYTANAVSIGSVPEAIPSDVQRMATAYNDAELKKLLEDAENPLLLPHYE